MVEIDVWEIWRIKMEGDDILCFRNFNLVVRFLGGEEGEFSVVKGFFISVLFVVVVFLGVV